MKRTGFWCEKTSLSAIGPVCIYFGHDYYSTNLKLGEGYIRNVTGLQLLLLKWITFWVRAVATAYIHQSQTRLTPSTRVCMLRV